MTILMFGMQFLHHQLHHQQLFSRLVINVFQRPRVSSFLPQKLILSSRNPWLCKMFFFFLLFFSSLCCYCCCICRYVMGTNFTFTRNVIERKNLYRGSFFFVIVVVVIKDREEGVASNIYGMQMKRRRKQYWELFLLPYKNPVKMYFHFDYSSYCFLIFLILSLKGITLDYTIASSIVYWNMMMVKKNQFKVLVHAQHPYWYFSLSDLLEDSFIMFLYLC